MTVAMIMLRTSQWMKQQTTQLSEFLLFKVKSVRNRVNKRESPVATELMTVHSEFSISKQAKSKNKETLLREENTQSRSPPRETLGFLKSKKKFKIESNLRVGPRRKKLAMKTESWLIQGSERTQNPHKSVFHDPHPRFNSRLEAHNLHPSKITTLTYPSSNLKRIRGLSRCLCRGHSTKLVNRGTSIKKEGGKY